ncbi:MAG: hypothetical protein E6501_36685, partial [Bradyrhizobium sp.]|nr:hypothetical protein [Bradyrhizobium sp.]
MGDTTTFLLKSMILGQKSAGHMAAQPRGSQLDLFQACLHQPVAIMGDIALVFPANILHVA